MASTYTALDDLGTVALSHRGEMDEVKRRLDIHHGYFDAWMYGFLENKKFDIDETVAKLQRRFAMEVNELATYELTDYMRESLRKGIIQEIGTDKAGRVAFFISTRRDFPQSKHRDEQRRSFDMFMNYGTRLRHDNKRSQIVMLINQSDSSFFKNVDMTFQADVALRISKYYPGGVDKMYICKMGRTLAMMAKPIFKRLPSIVADRIIIIDDNDIKQGVLLDLFDAAVLPVALGGKNECDDAAHWNAYAENVENYYSGLKRAVNERGLTVKEYELEMLGIDPSAAGKGGPAGEAAPPHKKSLPNDTLAQSVQSLAVTPVSQRHSTSRLMSTKERTLSQLGAFGSSSARYPIAAAEIIDPEAKPLMTCLSEESYVPASANDGASGRDASGTGVGWAELVASLPDSLALFFLEELLRWRTVVESSELSERYKILDSFASELTTAADRGVHGVDVSDTKWYTSVPSPLRALFRILLLGITVMNAIYFIVALVFYAVFCADVILTLFFGFYVQPSFVFPLSAVLLMVAIQGASLCTRAADCIQAVYRGNVIPLFERLGSRWGGIAEMTLFVVLIAVQFTVFCIFAARYNALQGLEISFATGCVSAVVVIGCTHVFFFTGLFASPTARRTENGLAALPFFLALNVGKASKEQLQEMDTRFMLRTSSYVICGIPLTLSLLLGTGFLLSRILAFYIATLCVSLLAAFVVHYYADTLSYSLGGSLLRFTLWMMTLVWCYVTFSFGFQNFDRVRGASVIVASVLNGFFVVLAIACLRQPGRSWLLRVSYIIVLLYILGCWISIFPLVNWRLGLFGLALIVHNVLNIVFAPRSLIGIHASFLVTAAVLLLGVSTVFLGYYGTTILTTTPQSLPPAPTATPTLTPLELYHRYPVCALTLGQDNSFRVVDVALMNELVGARFDTTRNIDFNNWFGTSGVTYSGVVAQYSADGISWTMHQFLLPTAANTTILVLNNRFALSSIVSMVAWIDAIALSPLSIFMPTAWIDNTVYVVSFATRLIPFAWTSLMADLPASIIQLRQALGTNVIVTGTGVTGGFLSVAASQAATQAIVFASPGLVQVSRKLGTHFDGYHKYVLSIGAYHGILNDVGGQDNTISQRLTCNGTALYCIRPQYFSTELLSACEDAAGRRHV